MSRRAVWKYRYLYVLGMPAILFFVLFKYSPMYGVLIAFQDYNAFRGVWGSDWVGFEHFARLASEKDFWLIFRNTVVLSLLNIVFLFPAPIVLALLMNELRAAVYKRVIQTVLYLPHFISWVIVMSLTYLLLSSEQGLVNKLIAARGGEAVSFLFEPSYFYPLIVGQGLWKEVGWSTIIYLAAIAGVDSSLYEAAKIDGASRLTQVRHVTIPAIAPTIIILFILSLGHMMDVNFEQMYLMQNPTNTRLSEVFDTYVFKIGVQQGDFSFSTAVGLFKSVIGLALVLAANRAARQFGREGIW
ncbi:MAG: sugar ABC transporter permease [Paenibacillaceae bacterium]|nr:sugar ABC transporter permease [Paenibacillaceae bacterium]